MTYQRLLLLLYYIFIILCGQASRVTGTESCNIIDDISRCRYTVVCKVHPGSAHNLNCDDEPYVTFMMMDSHVENLSAGLFGATNFDSRVRVFKAINNTWTNILSLTFRYYSKTVHMDLSHNGIRQIENEAFKNVFGLKTVNLSSNEIHTLYPRSLVLSDTMPCPVQILDLSNNKMEDISPDLFHQYYNLQELYLQNNNILSISDDSFTNLKNLTHLYLQNNRLISINMTLIHLKMLQFLDLSSNQLKKLSGYEMNRLTSLRELNISNNKIEFVESNCFNQAYNLEIIDFSNNKITSVIQNIMFINNEKLHYLNFFSNYITGIEGNTFQHNILDYLNLEDNKISGEITDSTFTGLQKIKILNLFHQNITSINTNAFKGMTELLNLNLSKNHIDYVHNSSFTNAESIKVLDLSYNNISSLNFLYNALTNLTELYLSFNNIVYVPEQAFVNQTLVTKLDLSMNKIVTIEQNSLPLGFLQFLNVSGNPISGTIKCNALSPARFLRFLDLSNLNISRVDDMAFSDLPLLARLNLSHNPIEFIGVKNFINLDNMFSLDLSYNKLSNLTLNNTSIKNLKALYLNNNKFSEINGVLPNASNILYLDISNNNISDLTDNIFGTLRGLRVLLASHNKIKEFNNPQVNLLSELTNLGLASNQISVIDLSYFKELVSLDISNNTINYINTTFFKNLAYLQALDLSNNNIISLPPGLFQNIKILKLLNVSSNKLSNLRYGSLRGLHRTEVLDLSRNSIVEMDVDVFHECTELRRLIIDYNRIEQLDVETLLRVLPKLMTLSIGGNPLSCKEIVRNIKNINKTSIRLVEVTSMDKIYHEDNVHGIKCGDMDVTISTIATTQVAEKHTEGTNSSISLIWCSILTLICIIIAVALIICQRKRYSSAHYSESRIQLRRSLELSGSEFQSDLLN